MKDNDYCIRISSEFEDPEWDAFVAGCPDGHHVQTSLWGIVKAINGWKPIRIYLTEDDRIVSGCQLLIRKMPFLGNIGYITKGPLCDPDDPSQAQVILKQVLKVGRDNALRYLVIQPPNCGTLIHDQLPSWGFQPSWLEVAPTATIMIDLTSSNEEIMAQMKRQNRQNIRRSEKDGITVRDGNEHDLHSFYLLHQETSKRQGFDPYPEEYFVKMWQVLEPHGYIKLFLSEYEHETISALLVVAFGNIVLPKILGWSGLHGKRRPNEAVFWGSIKWAKTAGYQYYDMEGIDPVGARAILDSKPLPDSLRNSPTRFKLGFGGQVVLYPEPYDYIYNPVLRWTYGRVSPKIENWPLVYNKILDWNRMQ